MEVFARWNTIDNSSFPICIIIGLIPPCQHFPFFKYFDEFLLVVNFLESMVLVEFDTILSRIRSWNSTLGFHKLLRLSFFGEFKPGEIRLNSFLGTESPAEYICFQKYKKVRQISNSHMFGPLFYSVDFLNKIFDSSRWAVTYLPNIFIFLEADVLGGRLGEARFQEMRSS